jgi:phage N-6-adenine-methyltransferase
MINKGLFTSNTGEWETPQDFFDELNKEFHFEVDVCATPLNSKCDKFYEEGTDGLSMNWSLQTGWKWMNPPYGREIGKWIKKASKERKVVALLPSRTDTRWFHDYIYKKPYVEIRFIKGRLKFGGAKNSAPFPSMLVIFK